MRVYTRYRASPKRGRLRSLSYWLVAIAGVAVLAWIFWDSGRQPRRSARSQTSPPSTPAVTGPARPSPVVGPVIPPGAPLGQFPIVVVPPPARSPATGAPPAVVVPPPPVTVLPPIAPPPAPFPSNLVLDGRWDGPRPVGTTFELQLALARQGFSSGSIDGRMGSQTRAALRAYQNRMGLRISGVLDQATRRALAADAVPIVEYRITAGDLARLGPVSRTWLGKSQQRRLDYESLLELVAEQTWSHPRLIRELNPTVNWSGVRADTVVRVPNVAPPPRVPAASLKIELSGKVLRVYDRGSRLIGFMPCSIAQRVEKRPVGTLRIVRIARNPVYTFNPAVFPESAEARRLDRKLDIPAGPNNPVGVAWIGLDRPGYGIHGTPQPEQVGRTESHGCFRLANWNAAHLASIVSVGLPVYIEP